MSSSGLKKFKLNFLVGVAGHIVTLALGLIIPRFFILEFGSEVNGYIQGLEQIFVYVALLEAGVGSASLQALYHPMGNGDKERVNGILAATNFYYKRTGLVFLAITTALSFIYPLIIDSELNYFVMVVLFLILGASGSVPYFFNSKYGILLGADGKEYVGTVVTTITQIITSLGRIIAILSGVGVVVVQSIYLAVNLLKAFIIWIYIRKNYKWVNLKAKPDKHALSQKNSVLVHQISTLIFNNTDTLLLTFFCDLKTASIYTLYKSFIGMISTVIQMLFNAMKFKFGQTFNDRKRFLPMHDFSEILNISITFAMCTVALMFLKPFMSLYTEGMDTNYIIAFVPLLFIVVEILSYARIPTLSVITYAGHFKQTQWRSIFESVINLTVSLILIKPFGICGVLLGTIAALLYRVNDIIVYVNKRILKRSPWITYKTWIVNTLISVASYGIFCLIPLNWDNYFIIILSAGIICLIVTPAQILISFLVHGKRGIALIKSAKQYLIRR